MGRAKRWWTLQISRIKTRRSIRPRISKNWWSWTPTIHLMRQQRSSIRHVALGPPLLGPQAMSWVMVAIRVRLAPFRTLVHRYRCNRLGCRKRSLGSVCPRKPQPIIISRCSYRRVIGSRLWFLWLTSIEYILKSCASFSMRRKWLKKRSGRCITAWLIARLASSSKLMHCWRKI